MPTPGTLDASAVHRWCARALREMAAHQRDIDELNVYPVYDRDTGTNLLLTLRAADVELRAAPTAGVGGALRAMARGAVLGARGNSGVIVSQFLQGLAEELRDTDRADGVAFAGALARADALAWAAVERPVEGTALSVIRAGAVAACARTSPAGRDAAGAAPCSLTDVVDAVAEAAAAALDRTPAQLPVLARAGVVDAGGRGVVVLLDALAATVAGAGAGSSPPVRAAVSRLAADPAPSYEPEPAYEPEPGYGYEVQYLLDATEADVRELRARLSALGGSVAVVGTGEGRWNVHAHVDDVGAAIEAGIDAGRPSRVTVTRFADQPAGPAGARRSDQDGPARAPEAADRAAGGPVRPASRRAAVVAVAPGEGLSGLFEAEGVVVVEGGIGRAPSVEEVRRAIVDTGAASVVLLPNHGEVTTVADRAARAARAGGQRVAVVPTRSPVQGLAAVAVHDEERWFDDDVIAMAEAAAATRWAEVQVAAREALTMAGRCQAGDILGLAEGDVVLIRRSVEDAARELVDRMLLAGGELVTVILGAGTGPDLATALSRHVAVRHPAVEVHVYDGGQSDHPVILGVE